MSADGVGEATSLEVTVGGLLAGLTTIGEGYLYMFAVDLLRFPLDGPIDDPLAGELVMDTSEVLGVTGRVGAFDAGRIVISPWNSEEPAPIYRAAPDGSNLDAVACDAVGADSLQTDGSHWYWVDGAPGEAAAIARAPY